MIVATRAERLARVIAQERELDRTLMQRELQTPTPSVATGRGVPAVNALSVRVTERYNSRAGMGRWSNVSVMDAHKPVALLRNLRPKAETPCISYMPDGSVRVFTPTRVQRNYTKRSAPAQVVVNEREASRLRALHIAGEIGNVD